MKLITDFLSSPIWQGVGVLLALLTIIINLDSTQRWLGKRPFTNWFLKVPWVWIFIIVGITAGIGTSIKFQDVYRGILVALVAIALGFGIQLTKVFRSNAQLESVTAKYHRLTTGLRRVVHLLPSEFSVADWRITHTIDENGSDSMREELTIMPSGEPVYFYFKKYVVAWDASETAINVAAENLLDNTPLSIFEIERTGKYIYFVILLDPPSTITSPKRIAINCERDRIWNMLLKNNEAEGSLQVNHQTDIIRMELLAPRNRKWKGFHPAPVLGDVELESSGSVSRVSWVIKKAQPKKYAYQTYLEGKL